LRGHWEISVREWDGQVGKKKHLVKLIELLTFFFSNGIWDEELKKEGTLGGDRIRAEC